MPPVSRRPLSPKVEQRLKSLLVECLGECRDIKTTANLIDSLLTPSEKIMIAKRVAIALMLIKGRPPAEISDTLKVTETTINSVLKWMSIQSKEYRAIIKTIVQRDKEQMKHHEELVEKAQNSTPRWGTNWSAVKRRQWEKVKDNPEPPF